MRLVLIAVTAVSLAWGGAREDRDRDAIIAKYQRTIDAMNRGDADEMFKMETADWVSITLDQKPITLKELEPQIRRDITSMKNPPGWTVFWKPDYEKNGTGNGLQVYDVQFDRDRATVLYLIGGTHAETIAGSSHQVWQGSHIRDSWVKTREGWKRSKHEKLTVNERLVDGRPAQ